MQSKKSNMENKMCMNNIVYKCFARNVKIGTVHGIEIWSKSNRCEWARVKSKEDM